MPFKKSPPLLFARPHIECYGFSTFSYVLAVRAMNLFVFSKIATFFTAVCRRRKLCTTDLCLLRLLKIRSSSRFVERARIFFSRRVYVSGPIERNRWLIPTFTFCNCVCVKNGNRPCPLYVRRERAQQANSQWKMRLNADFCRMNEDVSGRLFSVRARFGKSVCPLHPSKPMKNDATASWKKYVAGLIEPVANCFMFFLTALPSFVVNCCIFTCANFNLPCRWNDRLPKYWVVEFKRGQNRN